MRRLCGVLAVTIAALLSAACAATAMSPAELSRENNPRIMGVITANGETIRFNRQRDTITWRADTLRVASRDSARRFAADEIRSVLVDRNSSGRMLAFGLPVGLLLVVIFSFWNMAPYT